MANIFYIIAEKIQKGFIVIKNKVQAALRRFFEMALGFLRKVADKYSVKKGRVYKGQRHFYKKKNGRFREGSTIIHLDEELGEYEKTEITQPIAEENVPEQYRNIKEEEVQDNTEELDAVLSF